MDSPRTTSRLRESDPERSNPLSVTYNSVSKSLARQSSSDTASRYGTSDGEFTFTVDTYVRISDKGQRIIVREVKLSRNVVDSTDAAFTQLRYPVNSVGLIFETDELRTESSVDVPLLRTALLALVDSTFQGRILGDEK